MKKNNSTNIILIMGAVVSVFCSFVLKSAFLGVAIFAAFAGFVVYKQRTLFRASSAATAYKKGEIEKSFQLYEKVIYQKDCPTIVKITYAYRLISEGKVDESAKVLGTLNVNEMNGHDRLNYNATHALCIWKQGNIQKAIGIYETLLNEKNSVLMYEVLGYLLIEAKQYKKALSFNSKAIELHDTNERIKCNLATSYYYVDEHSEAAKIYKELIEDYANLPEPYYYYGLLLETREKYKGAIKYWNMALEKKFSALYTLEKEAIQDKIDERTP